MANPGLEVKKNTYKHMYYPPGGLLMWIIIFLELLTFGIALIIMVYSAKEEPVVFHESRLLLNTTYGALNTVFLLTSGFFMTQFVRFQRELNLKRSKLFLVLTMLGGIAFLFLKAIEYSDKIDAGLTIGYNNFFAFYWMLTLFHVIHVVVGLVILGTLIAGLYKKNPSLKMEDVETSAAFWHMCDLIWILLFPIIYLFF